MSPSIEIVGSFKGSTGHDHHTRSIVRALHGRGVKIHLEDLPQWSPNKLPEECQDGWFDQFSEPVDAQNCLFFCMPHQVQQRIERRIINYTMFEADRIPQRWVECSRNHDLIVVPLESSREAWINSGVDDRKIAVCPLGADSVAFKRNTQATYTLDLPARLSSASGRKLADCKVRFLNVSAAGARKNLHGLLRAWISATTSGESAALIVKGSFPSPDARTEFWERLREMQRSLGKTLLDAAPLFWLDGALAAESMPQVYHCATHYISASHGEGFDLPMLEAAFCGLQLIAPRHSSYACYLNDEIAHLLPAPLIPVETGEDSTLLEFFAGANWWQPDHEALCRTIRGIIDGTTGPKKSAREALAHLNWDQTADRLIELIF